MGEGFLDIEVCVIVGDGVGGRNDREKTVGNEVEM